MNALQQYLLGHCADFVPFGRREVLFGQTDKPMAHVANLVIVNMLARISDTIIQFATPRKTHPCRIHAAIAAFSEADREEAQFATLLAIVVTDAREFVIRVPGGEFLRIEFLAAE